MPDFRLKRPTVPHLLLALAILGYALLFSYLTLRRYAAFEARALDMGNLDQAIWNTAYGNWFHLTNQPGTVNRLSLHVEPLLLPIALLYRLYPGPPLLLVLQASVVALGAWPLFALARHELKGEWMALFLALAFLLNPTMQAANWLEFHPLTLAPTFLLATFYCLVTKRTGWYVGFAILAASCKEEIALLLFMIGLYALVILRRRQLGLFTMLLSLLWAFTAVFWIQTTFAAGNIHWGRYSYLGASASQKVLTLLTQPVVVLTQLGKAQALTYVALLLLPVGFIALLAPEVLLLALPSLAINLLADFAPMHQVTELIYAAPIVPFVMLATVYGLKGIGYWVFPVLKINAHEATKPQRTANYSFESLWLRVRFSSPVVCRRTWITVLILATALYAQLRYGYLPGSGNYQPFTVTDHHRRAASIIAQIPPTAKVSAQDRLNPHVSGRETIYIFPRVDDADTVFVDVTGPAWPQHPNDLRKSIADLLTQGFGIAAASDGYLLLRKGVANRQLPADFYSAWRLLTPPAAPHALDFGDALRLLDYQVTTDSHGELVTKLYWTALKPITQDLRFYVGYLDGEWNVLQDTQFYPPVVQLWYPTSQWPPGTAVLVQTLPWTLSVDRFTLAVGVYTGEQGWTTGARLPVTSAQPTLPVLEGRSWARLGGYQRDKQGMWVAVPLRTTLPANGLNLQLGGQIVVDGVTLPSTTTQAGATLPFTLYFHASQPPAFDYNLFVHLVDSNGNKVAQWDGQPHDAIGKLPATAWLIDQPVVVQQTLPVPADLPEGDYRLLTGLYNWQNGQRLPITSGNGEASDVVTIGTIYVK